MTRPASLVSVSVRTLAAAAALLALAALLASCSDAEEEAAQAPTVTATAGTGTPGVSPTPTLSTPAPVPSGWKAYNDAQLGFSLPYPADLAFRDLTGPSPMGGLRERALEFRSEDDPGRALTVSIIEEYPAKVDLGQWAVEYAACRQDEIASTSLDGIPAISCHRVVLGPPEPAAIAEYAGRIYLISSSFNDEEFTKVLQGFRF